MNQRGSNILKQYSTKLLFELQISSTVRVVENELMPLHTSFNGENHHSVIMYVRESAVSELIFSPDDGVGFEWVVSASE